MKERLKRAFLRTLESIRLDLVIPKQIAGDRGALITPVGRYELAAVRNLIVVAFGKAAHVMARSFLGAIAPGLPPRMVPSGIVVGPELESAPTGFESFVGGHPVPNQGSSESAKTR